MCRVGNKCFKLVPGTDNNRRTWAEALKICRSGPGQLPDLASVTSEAENGKTSHQSIRETTLIHVCTLFETHVAIVDENSVEHQIKWSWVFCRWSLDTNRVWCVHVLFSPF